MKAILTRRNERGEYDEVGMWNRTCLTKCTLALARAKAHAWSQAVQQPVRVQIWPDHEFYGNKPPALEFVVDP